MAKQRDWLNAQQAAAYAGCSARSVKTWWGRGLAGVVLASRLRVGRRMTTAGALERFFRAVDAAKRDLREELRTRGRRLAGGRAQERGHAANLAYLREKGLG